MVKNMSVMTISREQLEEKWARELEEAKARKYEQQQLEALNNQQEVIKTAENTDTFSFQEKAIVAKSEKPLFPERKNLNMAIEQNDRMYSQKQIAEELGVQVSRVSKWLAENGIEPIEGTYPKQYRESDINVVLQNKPLNVEVVKAAELLHDLHDPTKDSELLTKQRVASVSIQMGILAKFGHITEEQFNKFINIDKKFKQCVEQLTWYANWKKGVTDEHALLTSGRYESLLLRQGEALSKANELEQEAEALSGYKQGEILSEARKLRKTVTNMDTQLKVYRRQLESRGSL
jgi:hypothetical protein